MQSKDTSINLSKTRGIVDDSAANLTLEAVTPERDSQQPAEMRVLAVAVALCLLAQLSSSHTLHAPRNKKLSGLRLHRTAPPPPPPQQQRRRGTDDTGAPDLEPVFIGFVEDQPLDHFDPTNKATWRQRFFRNREEYRQGGPVFIFVGGESEGDPVWLEWVNSNMYRLAMTFKANMFLLEHRYFGSSMPTTDISTPNLKWLTPDQAVADIAFFIENLIQNGNVTRNQKVMLFGGSYAGNLAAWARIKYPHLVDAAVASSAPVHSQENFSEFFEDVAKSIRRVSGYECSNNIQKAFNRIKQLLMTTDGVSTIMEKFYMCSPLDTSNKMDVDYFFETLASPFALAVQNDRPNSYIEYSIDGQCQYMMGSLTDDEAVDALVEVFVNSHDLFFDCLEWGYKDNFEYLKDTDYGNGDRQWLYMTCSSLGYFRTLDGNSIFPKGYLNVDYYEQRCKDAFGDDFGALTVQRGVKSNNLGFGDRNPKVTNVMFVNGDIDPWQSLSILTNLSLSSPALVVSGMSHCYDMYADNEPIDEPQFIEARKRIKYFVSSALFDGIKSRMSELSPPTDLKLDGKPLQTR